MAKRWKANVQAPTVQQVRGALGAHDQGLIITTSDFSAGARAEARQGARSIGSAATSMLIGGSDPEMTDPHLNQAVLQRLALRSGGRLVAAGESAAVAAQLRAAVPAARLAVTHDVWHTGWSFAAILILLISEWLLRRRWGLR